MNLVEFISILLCTEVQIEVFALCCCCSGDAVTSGTGRLLGGDTPMGCDSSPPPDVQRASGAPTPATPSPGLSRDCDEGD